MAGGVQADDRPQDEPRAQGERRVRPATQDDASSLEADASEMGVFTEPGGEVPEYVPTDADEGLKYVVRYADVDSDGTRDAIAISEAPQKAGGTHPKGARIAVLCWDQSKDRWWVWGQLRPGRGETMFDEDSIAFAYDLNEDGKVEVGLLFYEENTWTDEPAENLYLYQGGVEGLYPVTGRATEALSGGAITSLPGDRFIIADVEDDYPGEEIVLSQAQTGDDDTPPYPYGMFVYCWDASHYSPARMYRSGREFEDADAAFIAFNTGTGGFEPFELE